MKRFNYFNFLRGEKVTIREILEEEHKDKASYYTVSLYETEEKIHIGIEPQNASFIKPNVTLFYTTQKSDIKGYTKWKNGIGTLGMLL